MYTLTNIAGHHFAGPEEVYVVDLHRTSAGLASISSNQALSLLDPGRVGQGPVKNLRTSHGNLTTLRVFDAGNSIVCTAGEDGSVGVWDLRMDAARAEVAHFAGEPAVDSCWRRAIVELTVFNSQPVPHSLHGMQPSDTNYICRHRASKSHRLHLPLVSPHLLPVKLSTYLIPGMFVQHRPLRPPTTKSTATTSPPSSSTPHSPNSYSRAPQMAWSMCTTRVSPMRMRSWCRRSTTTPRSTKLHFSAPPKSLHCHTMSALLCMTWLRRRSMGMRRQILGI